ncbi:Ger(x)C family spore germination protein [Alkalicoccobacillus gibsonii]|uniref:Ger(x)C family spore germination protein n=1 Tax=Alkalicoccobacillus gibsonii TaxID=79881 RepID=UPI001934675B|nr:Ger(x)C family spore germination protein [Alkalicoccobacillus gibsonii]MBM0066792.1 Ger(x)C family spore germination protein [Alkalicoccobacillus gibsonii]
MKYKLLTYILICCFPIFLTGCWDQTLLKEVSLIKAQAFDIGNDEDQVKTTIAIVKTDSNIKIPTENIIVSAEGVSSRNSRVELDKEIASELFASKNRVTLISSELVKQGDIYALLDVHFRSPLSALSAKLAITDDESGKILHAQPENNPLISNYLYDLIVSEEKMGIIPISNLQKTFTLLYDDGQDLILPRLTNLEEMAGAKITGSALFSNNRMTGTLNTDETTLLLLLGNSQKGEHRMTRKVRSNMESTLYDYITVDVLKSKRKLNVRRVDQNMYDVEINLTLKLDAIEYPADHMYKKNTIASLNEILSKQLTREANEILLSLQKANCDYLGIGRQVQARYNSSWHTINWKEVYPTINMKANVTAEIETHGIVN